LGQFDAYFNNARRLANDPSAAHNLNADADCGAKLHIDLCGEAKFFEKADNGPSADLIGQGCYQPTVHEAGGALVLGARGETGEHFIPFAGEAEMKADGVIGRAPEARLIVSKIARI